MPISEAYISNKGFNMVSEKKIKEIDSKFLSTPERELSNTEYMNIKEKSGKGAIPVDYFRQNLFFPTCVKETNLPTSYKKVIFDDENYKITVSNYLHQRHKDVLTALFIDNLGVSSPMKDGSYYIYTNLTHIAKILGYSSPNSASGRIVELIDDLRLTDIKVFNKNTKIEDSHTLLGESSFDTEKGNYRVLIPSKTSQYHILNFAVEIPRELNRLILSIPFKCAKLKASVSYILSNKSLRNGITLEKLLEKIGVEVNRKNKSNLKKEFMSNLPLLDELGIHFDEITKKLYLKTQMKFVRQITFDDIIKSYSKDGKIDILDERQQNKLYATRNEAWQEDFEIVSLKELKEFENKHLRINEVNYLVKEIFEDEKLNIIIKVVFNVRFEKEINTKSNNCEYVMKKLNSYNKDYLDFTIFSNEIKF
jgi:hypothetical protein